MKNHAGKNSEDKDIDNTTNRMSEDKMTINHPKSTFINEEYECDADEQAQN